MCDEVTIFTEYNEQVIVEGYPWVMNEYQENAKYLIVSQRAEDKLACLSAMKKLLDRLAEFTQHASTLQAAQSVMAGNAAAKTLDGE